MKALKGKSEEERNKMIHKALPDEWIDENLMLVNFVFQFNVQAKNKKAPTKAEKCEIWRTYCKFLKILLKT
jgi:hypothetical protein